MSKKVLREIGRQNRREIRRVKLIEETDLIGRNEDFMRRNQLTEMLARPENSFLRPSAKRLGLI